MNLKKALNRQAVSLDLQSTSKEEVIDDMIDILVKAGMVQDPAPIRTAVIEREGKMSTGMQHGIAIPHGKSDTVPSLVAAVGIHKAGLDFDSIDGLPCHLFILTVSPVNRTGPHIQFLAEISRLLNDAQVRDQLLHATSEEEVIRILSA